MVVASFTHTLISLFIRLYHYTFKWCCRKVIVEHGDHQLNAAYWKLNAAYWKLNAAYWKLNAAYWKLNAAYWKLNAAYWKLNAAYWKLNAAYWKCSVKIILNTVPQICFCNIFKVMSCTCLIFYSIILFFNVLIWHLCFILMPACGLAIILYSMQVRIYYYNADTSNLQPLCDGY